MSERDKLIRDLFARANAAGRKVYGYSSGYASCAGARAARPKKGKGDESEAKPGIVPGDWDRLCVEGDQQWSIIPLARDAERGTEKE